MQAKVGHYEIVSELGRGGMGVVFKGHEPALGRYVAIKQLSPALAHDESIKQRFLREARSMAALNDPHIVQIYLIGEENGQPFFAMEFVEGESLSALLKREGRMSAAHAARVVFQTAQGLATAHAKGVIHRDIKPGNLLLTTRGMLKIADFGIALSASDSLANKLTATGGFVGTPGYLSPEVCMGKPVDARADIFALGIVLFELLTGRMPFRDESPLGLMLEVVQTEIPDIRELNADVDAELAAILAKMTAKNPDDRFASADDLAAALSDHPLVTRNAAVTARIVMSPAAATVFAPMTPIPQSLLTPAPNADAMAPANVATRALSPSPAAAGLGMPQAAAAGQDLQTHRRELEPMARPSALARPDRSSGNNNGMWLVAAVVVLLVAGGAWAMRAKWMPGATGESVASAGSASNASAVVAGTAAVAATATPGESSARAPTEAERADRAATVAGLVAVVDGANANNTPGGTGSTTADPSAGTIPPGGSNQASATSNGSGESRVDGVNAQSLVSIAPAQAQPGVQDGGPLTPREARAERRAAIVENIAERRDARREETREPVAVRTVPRRIAVITIGDPAVTGPARHMLEEALGDGGFELLDTDMAGVGDLSPGEIPRAVGHLAQRNGVGAVAVIRAEPAGTQQLNFYGRSAEMFTATLSVKLYDAQSRSPLGAGFRAPVNYTGPTADHNTREALQPNVGQVLSTLARYRDGDRS